MRAMLEGVLKPMRPKKPLQKSLPIDIVAGDDSADENVDSSAKVNMSETEAGPADRDLTVSESDAMEELELEVESVEEGKAMNADVNIDVNRNRDPQEQHMHEKSPEKNRARQQASPSKARKDASASEMLEALIEEGRLAKNVFSALIERFNLSPAVVLHALYVNSGNIDDTVCYLSEPLLPEPWSMSHDQQILMQQPLDAMLAEKDVEAVEARRRFLVQVCEESVGTLEALDAQLQKCKQ